MRRLLLTHVLIFVGTLLPACTEEDRRSPSAAAPVARNAADPSDLRQARERAVKWITGNLKAARERRGPFQATPAFWAYKEDSYSRALQHINALGDKAPPLPYPVTALLLQADGGEGLVIVVMWLEDGLNVDGISLSFGDRELYRTTGAPPSMSHTAEEKQTTSSWIWGGEIRLIDEHSFRKMPVDAREGYAIQPPELAEANSKANFTIRLVTADGQLSEPCPIFDLRQEAQSSSPHTQPSVDGKVPVRISPR